MTRKIKEIIAYTDGACKNNGKENPVGGYGVYLRYIYDDNFVVEIELFDGEKDTTNNKMELKAVIEALTFIQKDIKTTLYTDSKYVIDAFGFEGGEINGYIKNWKRNGWKLANKNPVKNRELMEQLYSLIDERKSNLKMIHVYGHQDNEGNIKADALANEGAKLYK